MIDITMIIIFLFCLRGSSLLLCACCLFVVAIGKRILNVRCMFNAYIINIQKSHTFFIQFGYLHCLCRCHCMSHRFDVNLLLAGSCKVKMTTRE